MAEPIFFTEGNLPKSTDQEWRLLAKMAGSLYALAASAAVAGTGVAVGRIAVDPLGIPLASRQLSATGTSSNTALTASCRRVSIRAVTADIRYVVGSSSQTATATSHFIAQDERLDLALPSTPNIAVIRNASTSGTLEVTELV